MTFLKIITRDFRRAFQQSTHIRSVLSIRYATKQSTVKIIQFLLQTRTEHSWYDNDKGQ